ncbi:Xanthine dehydrogenase [Rhodovastum atsumiense]|uniref:Xanthine dehydrogenase n=1 Tax=Rhodovastum atsumiense TaxID=504468 RepID=A0A5M6IWH8_9PROT|nr:XdhC/CoxI family protein [Rhodovastum atsumiense]KAA5612197.1 xanthine dehydrogenase [Rhodovastum atsumiense]CAH2603846.1 Xanthine dehydrogenase [Rhodovastum atsumiense]
MDVYEQLIHERAEGRSCALATIVNVVGSIPSYTCAKMLVREDGTIVGTIGGGAAEGRAIAIAREVLETGRPQMISFNLHENPVLDIGMVCGGSLDIFVEAIRPSPTAYIFGGGHIGFIMARLARLVGFEVVVIDDRPEFANRDRFPEVQAVHAGDLAASMEQLRPNRSSLIFIATRGHGLDGQALAWALGTSAGYIGMIGSKRKVITIGKRLMAQGIPAEQFRRVQAPVGLDIGADTPEEIAIAVIAEMIANIRKSEGARPLVRTMADLMARVPASGQVHLVGTDSDTEELGAA